MAPTKHFPIISLSNIQKTSISCCNDVMECVKLSDGTMAHVCLNCSRVVDCSIFFSGHTNNPGPG